MANRKTKTKKKSKTRATRGKNDRTAPRRKAKAGVPPAKEQIASAQSMLVSTAAAIPPGRSTLTDGECDNIASDCVCRITGSKREYSRSDQLQQYGVNTEQQCRAIVDLIIGDRKIGVGRYKFKIVDSSKISGIAPSWTMGQLANTIQGSAVPALATTAAAIPSTQSKLTDGECDNISSDCVRRITSSKREYSRSDQLQQYGVNNDQQCRAIADLIIGDRTIGVGRYKFKIVDISKIIGLAPSWTMGQLANTIQSSAVPV